MNDPETCQHDDFDEYFEVCNDCGTKLEDMPPEIQAKYHEITDDEE